MAPNIEGSKTIGSVDPMNLARTSDDNQFLRIPPFPGARVQKFVGISGEAVDRNAVVDRLRALQVGGNFWGARPELPQEYIVVRQASAIETARHVVEKQSIVCWTSTSSASVVSDVQFIAGECDPWHVLAGASALIGEHDRDVLFIAWLLGVPCFEFDEATGAISRVTDDYADLLDGVCASGFVNPFTGKPMDAVQAIELCGFWRQLIDSNRGITVGLGFAFWKQPQVVTLLWNGSAPIHFVRDVDRVEAGSPIAAWRAKLSPEALSRLEQKRCRIVEVEDGFLRSRGLGADCIPPLSITVDWLGEHFDPSKPSELEKLIQEGNFDEQMLDRAKRLIDVIVEAGIGKYEAGTEFMERPAGDRRHILVPGQVEDDRSVQLGGCGLVSNLELLARVRDREPDAYILYKPHPDVVAGHRRGAIANDDCLRLADEIVADSAIASLIDMVDEVHVNTSLAGFEALVRGKQVTTFGVPFYAGWRLTNDLGPVPTRRYAKRSIEELVAATLLIYPRYIDPVSGLPCPAEIIVSRLSTYEDSNQGFIVGIRRLQGRVKRRLRGLVQ